MPVVPVYGNINQLALRTTSDCGPGKKVTLPCTPPPTIPILLAEPSFGTGLRPRAAGLGRQAEPLQQLYSTSPVLTRPYEQQQQPLGSSDMGKSSSDGTSGVGKSSGSASVGANGGGASNNQPARKTTSQTQITALGGVGRMSMQVKVSEGATKKVRPRQVCSL